MKQIDDAAPNSFPAAEGAEVLRKVAERDQGGIGHGRQIVARRKRGRRIKAGGKEARRNPDHRESSYLLPCPVPPCLLPHVLNSTSSRWKSFTAMARAAAA